MSTLGPVGYPWYTGATVVLAGIAAMGLVGFLLGPQGGRGQGAQKQKGQAQKQKEEGGLKIVPLEGNFVAPKEEEDDPAYEQLSQLRSHLDTCITRGDFITAQKIVEMIEKLVIETWGLDSWQRGLSLLPVARFYEATNPAKYIPVMEEAARVLKLHGHPSLVLLCGKLRNAYAPIDPEVSFNWAKEAEVIQSDVIADDPSLQNTMTYAVVCSNLASSAFVCGYFQEVTKWRRVAKQIFFKYFPMTRDCMSSVESWSNSYFVQGEREEAVGILREYLEIVKQRKEPQDSVHPIERYTLFLAVDMCFMCENFEEALEFSTKLAAMDDDIELQLQSLCDILIIHRHLGNEEEARKTEALLRGSEEKVKIASRSKFLTTLDCSLNDEKYFLEMKVNQGPYPRQEGERYKPLDTLPEIRLLKRFYLVVEFENPEPGSDPLVIEQEISQPEFTLNSPALPAIPIAKKYYSVNFLIYEDFTKTNLIGDHYQLILPSTL
eukprot:TRINITY_DN5383_c0_g1_i1.p1 TRINITY_DN5383_c0_g1~~TRINITY_DN5383_c0_g1_i1.p1  ORF type:complete len:492 (-),score=144.77 TRINITY_DN5383_c0_g1_i1:149-1624(-)